MNMKNIFFSLFMMSAVFTSHVAIAGVPPMNIEFDKIGATVVGGSAGASLFGYLGAVKGGALLGGLIGGPAGAFVGGVIGFVGGGLGGATVGWFGLVVKKAVCNEFKM